MIAAAPFLLTLLAYIPLILLSTGLTSIDFDDIAIEVEAVTTIKFTLAAFFAYVGGTGLAALFSRWLVSPREPVPMPPVSSS